MNASYDYRTLRHTGDGDCSAQLILLMRLSLGYTAYCWFIEAVPLALISSWLAHHMRHDWSKRRIQLRLTPLDQLPAEILHLAPC
jgi:hypothetical protein